MTTMSEWLLRLHFLLVLLLCCVYPSSSVIIKNPVVGLVSCRPRQTQAFTQFKNEFDTRGCNHSDNLNGVRCDNSTGAVTMLRLRACLRGVLKPNSSLFRFQQLRYLDLSHNDFTSSSLPPELGNLNKLEVLGLYSNGFLGQVPSSISNLSMLAVLDLSKNEFTGSFPLVRNLTKLNALELENNHFSGTIPPSLLTMPFLAILNLRGNHLTGSSIQAPNSSTSSWLEFLYLGNNHFDGKILDPISKLTNLKELDLSFLNTSYTIDSNLFSSLKSLLSLDLSGNSIFPASLKSDSNITLTLLSLSQCGLTEFPNILKTLHNLEYIDISKNSIKGKVPEWLWRLPHLSTLSISNNSFSGFEGSAGDILVNSSLLMLDLSYNSFKGAFPVPPLSITILSARETGFTGNIPLSICNCKFLTHLTLPYNNFTGPIPQCLSKLTVLNLRKNNLEGSLPSEFYDGASLHTLNVGHNRLSGKLPRSLLNCSSLQFLSIDNNKIEDTFPFWLKDLPNLQVFILRSNKFYGSISPPDQGPLGFPRLRILEISDNKFNGSLPPKYFANWKASSLTISEEGSLYMQYTETAYGSVYFTYIDNIDLQYKGLYMEQQKALTFYSAIDFSGNELEGEIPESVGLLKGLIALNLSNNAFTGHIPSSLDNLTELESLDLSRNRLYGTIPNGLKTLSFLAYVNVSYNQLRGEIPQGPQITGQPKSSFEGNAGLCGLPLDSCFGTSSPPTQQTKEEDKEKEMEVLNWKGVAIGYGPGVLLGIAIAQVLSSYKPEWFVKVIGPYKRRNR